MMIRDVMTREAKVCAAEDTVQRAARLMQECDCGLIPVADGDRLVGMITDRDITLRCIAEGKGAECKVRDAMTNEVKYCFEDEEVDHVCENLADIQLRRLPVLNRDKRLVGIVSLADLTREQPSSAQALYGISRPGGQHNQSRAA